MSKTITINEALGIIAKQAGRIFRVDFEKRTNGENRRMVARKGVYSHLSDSEEGLKYDPEEYDLLGVFDMNEVDYRSVNLRGLKALKAQGQEYKIVYPN